jgi:hypothetical protein
MKSSEQIGASVRVERSDPELVEAVAKAKAVESDGLVREVTRLEGLRINEATAHDAMMAAKHRLEDVRDTYLLAVDAYADAIAARRKEEGLL